MGNYDSEYKSYYGKIMERRKNAHAAGIMPNYPVTAMRREVPEKNINHIIFRRIIQELAGTLLLLIAVFTCKNIKTPETIAVYNSGKYFVTNGYTIDQASEYIKHFNISSIKYKGEELTDYVKAKVLNEQTFKEKMKETLVKPVLGIYALKDESQKIYSIETASGTQIISIGDGKVTKTGEDKTLGKYMVIDNGSGIESVYGSLDSLDVKEGDAVLKGQMIGKSGKVSSNEKPVLLFQLKYMGEARDITEYINI